MLFLSSADLAQEREIWKVNEHPLLKSLMPEKQKLSEDVSFIEILPKTIIGLYKITISEASGDVCPYYPSCSQFCLEAIHKLNIFEGTLLFFDRFTRDMNIVNRNERYPIIKNHRFYDPVDNYLSKSL